MERDVYEIFYHVEGTHWWFTARRRIILNLLKRYLPLRQGVSGRTTVCDLGTGCGYNLKTFGEFYNAVGMDFSLEAARFASKCDTRVILGRLPDEVPFADSSFDVVLLLDVLEHIEDDVASLRAAARLVRPGGLVLCTVPAYQWLWDQNDDYFHHYRRYSLGQMRTLAESAGLTLLLASYYNAFLFPPRVAINLWRKFIRSPEKPPGLSLLPKPLNQVFSAILGSERFILPYVRFPFGSSIVCVAKRANAVG